MKRFIALLLLSFLCFQLSRFFLVIPLDAFVCESAGHADSEALPGHAHAHQEAASSSRLDDDEYYFQHCKDMLSGLVPVQFLALPLSFSHQAPLVAWTKRLSIKQVAIESTLAPPFLPPRSA